MTQMRTAWALFWLAILPGCAAEACSAPQPQAAPAATTTRETTEPTQTRLRVATWNMEWLNATDGRGVVKREAEDYERLKKYAERIEADIIAVQEVNGETAARRVFDERHYGFHFASHNDVQGVGFVFKHSLSVTPNPDYGELNVGSVRPGVDVTVTLARHTLRLLNVHLKSGCFEQALDAAGNACQKLKAQVAPLEAWIDARAAEQTPFIVLGDFNRRFFKRPGEEFWEEIDDADPPNADLDSPTRNQTSSCWQGKYPHFIDHLVLDKSAQTFKVSGSFTQHLYDAEDEPHAAVLSDHCPLSIELDFGAGSGAAE